MMKTYDPELTPDEIMDMLKQNAVDDGYTQGGEGRLYVGSLFEGEVPAPIAGDADGNGTVNVADALMTLRVAMGLPAASSIDASAADMDGNGSITVADAPSITEKSYAACIKDDNKQWFSVDAGDHCFLRGFQNQKSFENPLWI